MSSSKEENHLHYVISFDLETTGLSRYQDQVTELGVEVVLWNTETHAQEVIGTFAKYVCPTSRTIAPAAALVTGITMDMLAGKPNISAVLREFLTYLDEVCTEPHPRTLVSYNGFQYDIPLLVAEMERSRAGSALSYFRQLKIGRTVDVLPLGRGSLDTFCLKRRKNGSCSYRLGDVYESLCHCVLDGAHGALADSRAVLRLLGCAEFREAFGTTLQSQELDSRSTRNIMQLVQEILKTMAHGPTLKTTGTKKRSRSVLGIVRAEK
jgi:DNA polymerase III epsilon subunit-like protein